ncbi:MAG: hypothetical protein FWD51_03305 [Betaproteobacteria bacterium]|nr:hypothetical protein [Betaproteobacteria bacterium]
MKISCLKNFRRQTGQGMTEFIIVLAAVAVCSVFVYTQFGDVLRSQVAVGALALAGQGSDGQTSAAQYAANQAATGASGGGMKNFGNPGSPGSPSPPSPGGPSPGDGGASDGSGSGGSDGSGDGTSGEDIELVESNTYITDNIGRGAIIKTLGPVTIVTNKVGGIVTRKTVEIVDGYIKVDGVQAKGRDGAVELDAQVNQNLGGNAKYGINPLDDPYVLALIAYSPTLQGDLKTLIEERGWNVEYTDRGHSYVNYKDEVIFIQKNQNEIGVLQSLSHEVGHALRRPEISRLTDFPAETQQAAKATRDAYMAAAPGSVAEREAMEAYLKTIRDAAVQKYLESEGDAVIKNIQIQREILAKGGPNIRVNCGVAGCENRYRDEYDQYLVDNNADEARKAIADKRKVEDAGSRGETYKENYEREWNEKLKSIWENDLKEEKQGRVGTP